MIIQFKGQEPMQLTKEYILDNFPRLKGSEVYVYINQETNYSLLYKMIKDFQVSLVYENSLTVNTLNILKILFPENATKYDFEYLATGTIMHNGEIWK